VDQAREPTSPAWYLVALAVFAIGWNGGVWWAGTAWDLVREAPITSANQALQAEGKSIAVFTDVVQANRQITCALSSVVREDRPQPIDPAPIPLTVEDDGATWTLVAFEHEGKNNVTVACAPKDRQVDNAQYAYATIDGFNTRLWTGNIISMAAIVVALAVAIVVFRIRRRQLRAQ
jgi:hypothetical protein